jgi:ATP synthase F1 epsilon subunit
MKPFPLEILTPQKPFYRGDCVSLIVPTCDGMYGVLADHLPMTAAIENGLLFFTTPDDARHVCAVERGMISVAGNRVRVLCDSAVSPDEVDSEAERRAIEQAEMELRDKQAQEDFIRHQISLAKALNRLKGKKSDMMNQF